MFNPCDLVPRAARTPTIDEMLHHPIWQRAHVRSWWTETDAASHDLMPREFNLRRRHHHPLKHTPTPTAADSTISVCKRQ